MKLKIADNLSLPHEAVTQTFGILAKRGVGKTYTASVMTEEMLKAGLHVVVIDPIGVWYGLRSSADGKSEGLPIIIAGGEHADIPIKPESGELLANLIIDNRLSMVVDVSLFRKGEQIKFMTAFAETLYRRNRNALHLVLDEADAFAPQRPMPGEQRLLGAIEDIVRRGRARGLGVTMITQRPSVLNKNVLTQIEVLVALRLTAPIDQKAVDEWVKTNAEEGQREEFLSAIGSLPVGTAYFWSPGWLKIFQKVHVRTRETLDSSSTPIAGKAVVLPEKMAKVDLDMLRDQLLKVTEKIESDDPKILRKRIAELEKQIAHPMVEVREIIPAGLAEIVAEATKSIESYAQAIRMRLEFPEKSISENELDKVRSDFDKDIKKPFPVYEHTFSIDRATSGKDETVIVTPTGEIRGGALRMLGVLVNGWPMRYTKAQMAVLAKMKITSGTFGTYYNRLKREGFIIESSDGMVDATDMAFDVLGESRQKPPLSPTELYQMWADVLPAGSVKILDKLIEHYPSGIAKDNLAVETGFAIGSGTFSTYLGNLRRNKLIEQSRDAFFAVETLIRDNN